MNGGFIPCRHLMPYSGREHRDFKYLFSPVKIRMVMEKGTDIENKSLWSLCTTCLGYSGPPTGAGVNME